MTNLMSLVSPLIDSLVGEKSHHSLPGVITTFPLRPSLTHLPSSPVVTTANSSFPLDKITSTPAIGFSLRSTTIPDAVYFLPVPIQPTNNTATTSSKTLKNTLRFKPIVPSFGIYPQD